MGLVANGSTDEFSLAATRPSPQRLRRRRSKLTIIRRCEKQGNWRPLGVWRTYRGGFTELFANARLPCCSIHLTCKVVSSEGVEAISLGGGISVGPNRSREKLRKE